MGRYSSVQAYADNNANVRSISYEQATGASGSSGGGGGTAGNKAVVTEKVSNPYGSTAGAGSGEFHVYRHARAREAARWKALDESEQQVEMEKEFQNQLQEAQSEEAQKTAKRRKKRQREKEAKQRKKNLTAAGILLAGQEEAAALSKNGEDRLDDDEFSYVPKKDQTNDDVAKGGDEKTDDADATGKEESSGNSQVDLSRAEIPTDGSFLEIMKKKIQEGQTSFNKSNSSGLSQGHYDDDDDYDEEGPTLPPPAKKFVMESRIIDEDDEEGPMPFR